MTFSLKSSFNFGARRSLLIAASKAVLYQCRDGQIDVAYEFSADEDGRENFLRCLVETNPDPIYILVDIVEEEYRQDIIPHVFGSDRKSVLERKFARLFRGAKYSHALNQGRETEGRKDDKVLLTAITRPDVVVRWVEVITGQKVPIAGIYSLPLLSQLLLKTIDARGPNSLLVSVQGASGLRQTFFRDRHFKISRLAQMPKIGSVPYASYVMAELEKLRRYLNSLGLISRDAPLDIYMLSHGEWLNELEQHCRDSIDQRYFLIDIAEVAARLGLKAALKTPYSDVVFNQLLLNERPKNHYAKAQETKYFALYRLRHGLLAASVGLLSISIAWSGFNFLDAVSLKRQALDAEQKANFYQARYSVARQDLPPTPVEPTDIKTAVDIVETLRHHKAGPIPMLELISAALDSLPNVRLDQIEWYSTVDPNATSNGETRRTEIADDDPIERDQKYSHYHIAVFRGHLQSFSGDYRAAIDQADELIGELARHPDVKRAKVLEYPLDVTSHTSLTGTATAPTSKPEARLVVKVVLGIMAAQRSSAATQSGSEIMRIKARFAANSSGQ